MSAPRGLRAPVALLLAVVVAAGAIYVARGAPVGPLGGGEDSGSDQGGMVADHEAPLFERAASRPERKADRHAPGRLIVRFRDGVPEEEKRQIRASIGVELLSTLPVPGAEVVGFEDGRPVEEVREAFVAREETAYTEPDLIYDISNGPDDPSFSNMWPLQNSADTDIEALEAWAAVTGSKAVTVGVVDTGVDMAHSDLSANLWSNPGELAAGPNGVDDDGNGYVDDLRGWDWIDRDNDPQDLNGHGTHVAGTIGAAGNNGVGVVGVNWKVSLVPLRVLDAKGSGLSSGIVAAFSYAGRMGFDVVNASLGGPSFSQSMYDAILKAPNTLFVVAAGNDSLNNDQSSSYPCNYPAPNLICVAASTREDKLASFSNYGATTVHMGAPGQAILSTLPGDAQGPRYGTYSGTSMAAPHVAGAAALLKAAVTGLGVSQLRSSLLGGVVPIEALQGKTVTGGKLNLRVALATAGVDVGETEPVAAAPTVTESPSPVPLTVSPSPLSPAPTLEAEQPPLAEEPTPEPSGGSPVASPSPGIIEEPLPEETTPVPESSPTEAPKIERQATLELRRHLVAHVRVSTGLPSTECVAGSRIVIKRNGVVIKRGTADDLGRFSTRLRDRPGRYVVRVPPTDRCVLAIVKKSHGHAPTASAESGDVTTLAGCWAFRRAERRLLRLANGARATAGLGRLRIDPDVSRFARSHSGKMASSGTLFHNSSTDLATRVKGWSSLGENVGVGSTASTIHSAFMGSTAHRQNILRAPFTHAGVGTVRRDGRLWVTVIFKAATSSGSTFLSSVCG